MSISFNHATNDTPPRAILPVLRKIKSTYITWSQHHELLPKKHKYTLGNKIDGLFIELIEAVASASFLKREKKQPYVQLAIRKVDTLKVLLIVLWEVKSLDTSKYGVISVALEEIGRMLGGWNGQLSKQNSPNK